MKLKSIALLVILAGAMPAGAATGVLGDFHLITMTTGGATVSTRLGTETSAIGTGVAAATQRAGADVNSPLDLNGQTAGFTNIPEAASSILGLIGAILLLRRRR